MINARVLRRGLLAGVACAAFAAPSAQATHYGTCSGFSDPSCNVQYVYDHSVQPVQDEIDGTVGPIVDDASAQIRNLRYWVNETIAGARDSVDAVLCTVFGAC